MPHSSACYPSCSSFSHPVGNKTIINCTFGFLVKKKTSYYFEVNIEDIREKNLLVFREVMARFHICCNWVPILHTFLATSFTFLGRWLALGSVGEYIGIIRPTN